MTTTFEIGDIVCYTPEQITCTIIAFYGADYKLQRHDNGKMFLSSRIVPGECGTSPPPPPPPPPPSPTFKIGDIVCYTPDQVTCTIIAFYGSDYKLQRHDDWTMFLSSRIVPGACGESPQPTPPNMETRTMALTEGQHTIQISLSGYDTLNATINVSSTGVTCVSVTGGACGGTGLPRVSTSGGSVTTYLKEGAAATNRCGWIASKDTSKVVFISEMVLAYNNLKNIGFTPTAAEIGNAVLMYSNLGTPASLWGC